MKDYVVRNKEVVFGDFETYEEAIALWRVLVKKHRSVVVQDNSRR
jgi:hypothetical protein